MVEANVKEAVAYIESKISQKPEIAVVLGSGLGAFAEQLENTRIMDYRDIPYFPISTVPGHKGRLVFGNFSGKNVVVMQGRFHYYEGYSLQKIAFPVQVFSTLGIQRLVLTCAVGAINTSYVPGDLVILKDHIKLCADNPLRGENPGFLGQRFFDMSDAYSKCLREIALDCGKELGIDLKEGVYAYMGGPNFETPAEIRALRVLGADVVGMSTVPEVIAAAHAGLPVLGIACCSNMAAGILKQPLTHEEVLETADKISGTFERLLAKIIKRL